MTPRRLALETRVSLEPGLALEIVETELRRAGIPVSRVDDRELACEWESVEWAPERVRARIRAVPAAGGTAVELELEGWDALLDSVAGADERELLGWVSGRVFAAAARAASPDEAAEWLTDRLARRPEGVRAKESYVSVPEHQPGFDAVLGSLQPGPEDVLLEIGCGGGILLEQALARGCRAVGIDHSRDMVELARERNATAVEDGRLQLLAADATALPFPDDSVTCAGMAHVYFHLSDPVGVLRELRRVLSAGGRLAVATLAPELAGHPYAAPEPLASRSFFWSDEQLADQAREAGFDDARVVRLDGRQLLEARAG